MTVKKNVLLNQFKSLLFIFWLLLKNIFIRVTQFFSLVKVIVFSFFSQKIESEKPKVGPQVSNFKRTQKFYSQDSKAGIWGGKLSKVQVSRSSLAKLGSRYSKMILIHGTFVGSDPLALKTFLEKFFDTGFGAEIALSRLLKMIERTFKLSGDLGNFTDVYAQSCESYLKIPTELFQWSSSNHHAARVLGAIDLLFIYRKLKVKFCLLVTLMAGSF